MLDLKFGTQAGSSPTPTPPAQTTGVSGPRVVTPVTAVQQGMSERVALWGAVVAVLIALAGGLFASYERAQESGRLESRTAQAAELVTQLSTGELGATLARATVVDRQLKTYAAVRSERTPWTSLLDAYADRIPSGVTLTATAFGEDATLRIDGSASRYEQVAQLMAALDGHEAFSEVRLISATRTEQASGTSIAFSLSASYESEVTSG